VRLVKRPARQPALSFERPADGALVEIWATKHTRRSHDRQLDGTTYYRPLVFISGGLYDHMPTRHATEADAVESVRRLFAK